MTNRRLLVVLAAVALLLTTATNGFTATTADRGVTVSVVDDDQALLGIERATSGTANGTTNLTVTVTNRLGTSELDTVTVRVDGESRDPTASGSLTPGAAESVTVTAVDCGSTVHVDAAGDGVDITLTRPIPCQ